ncbi:hypothetical protein [Terasakiella pusilla]|uniref:hypothetical protein n=1 Tax=Terasakiella pusilla TaxID=64973 RepID=UPI003AA89635
MAWSFREENNLRPATGGVLVRRYPYPFRAAVTISNDIDSTKPTAFDDFHDFVCGEGETAYGQGLGLEVSNSFWIWSDSALYSLFHGSPFDKNLPLSAESERLVALAQNGVIDSLHNFAQWQTGETFKRSDAERALDILDHLNIKPKVWINHGGGDHMRHQIEGRWANQWFGDKPDDPSYCYDLLRKAGFLYFSHDVMADVRHFGEHRYYHNQDSFDLAVQSCDFNKWFKRYNPATKQTRDVYEGCSEEERALLKQKFFNKILIEDTANDGNPILFFKRYRGQDAPCSGNFFTQVNRYSLLDLLRDQASCVIYQHFGIWRAAMVGRPHYTDRISKPPVLDIHNQTAFETLADFNRRQEVWVPAQSRFLDFLWMRSYLDFSATTDEGITKIDISDVNCPVNGKTEISADDLNGFAFTVPKSLEKVRIFLKGNEITQLFKRAQEPNFSERDALYIPYKKRFNYIMSSEFKTGTIHQIQNWK